MGISTAGNKFPTLIFLPKIMLIPIPRISMEPINDILLINLSLKKGSTKVANKVMPP